MIKLDVSPNSIVIYCEACGHWRGFAFDREDAERRGERHEELVHGDVFEFRRQVATNRRRRAQHADDSTVAPVAPEDSRHGIARSPRSRKAHV